MGVASLVLGIVSIVAGITIIHSWVGLILGIVGIVLGVLAKKNNPNGISTAGFVCAIVGTAIAAVFFVGCGGCAACSGLINLGILGSM